LFNPTFAEIVYRLLTVRHIFYQYAPIGDRNKDVSSKTLVSSGQTRHEAPAKAMAAMERAAYSGGNSLHYRFS
jgi:hypothetical protein